MSLQFAFAAATCSPGQLSDSMYDTDVLRGGQAIVSSDGLKMLLMGTDGSLKLFNQQTVYWSVVIPNPNNRYLVLQADGNLAMYDYCDQGTCPIWATGTNKGTTSNPSGSNPYHLFLQNDLNLILMDGGGNVLWTSGTSSTSTPVTSRSVCMPCAAGTYSSAFGNLCTNCGSGTFSGSSSTLIELRKPVLDPNSLCQLRHLRFVHNARLDSTQANQVSVLPNLTSTGKISLFQFCCKSATQEA